MSAAASIFLVRHGRTPLNAEGRFRGRLDPPLDDRGLAEASAAVHEIAGWRWSRSEIRFLSSFHDGSIMKAGTRDSAQAGGKAILA